MKQRPTNKKHLDNLQKLLAELVSDTLKQGYFGKVSVELVIADGTIQNLRAASQKEVRIT